MAYEPPASTSEETTWTVSARYGTVSAVTVPARVIIEDANANANADANADADANAVLQDLVNALSSRGGYGNVIGTKSSTARETRAMRPS